MKALRQKIAEELQQGPVAMEPEKLRKFLAAHAAPTSNDMILVAGEDMGDESAPARRALYSNKNGIAVIAIDGVLVGGNYDYPGWIKGYGAITAAVRTAVADTNVSGILLRIDSPGGYVIGCPECSDAIYAARASKPVVAFAEGMMASAAYWIGSAAEKVYASKAAPVGSIGVWSAHVDFTKALDDAGIKVTLIHAGARKVDTSPYRPLDEEALANLQGGTNEIYDLFATAVAIQRDMTIEAAKATEARMFLGPAAQAAGLIDGVSSLEAILAEMQSARSSTASMVAAVTTPAPGGNQEVQMDPKSKSPQAGADGGGTNVVSLEELLAAAEARAAKAEAKEAATVASMKAAAKTTLIVKAQAEGRVVGGNLKAVEKLAEHMEADELEGYLAELPSQVHSRARGIADSKIRVSAEDGPVAALLGMSAEEMNKFDSIASVHMDGTVTLKDGSRVSGASFKTGRA